MFNNNSEGQQGPSKGIRLSFLTAQDQAKFEQIFSQSAAGSNKVSAQVVSDLLRRSNLDNDSLAKIWDLASIANAPHLTFPEFAVAMFLTSKKLTGQQLPASLPPNVREETEVAMATIASTEPQQQLVNTSVPQQQFMMTGMQAQMTGMQPQMTGMPNNMMLHRPTPPRFQSPMQPMQTGFQSPQTGFHAQQGFQPSMPTGYVTRPIQQAPKLRLQNLDFAKKMMPNQSGAVNLLNPSLGTSDAHRISWKISPEDKQRYRDIFNAWEGSGSGFMSGDTAKDVLTQSHLAPQDLQKIWNLADAENRGSLDMDEFAVAMHLVYRKMNGFQVPATLPAELKPPSSLLKKFVLGRRPPPSAPKFVETSQEEEEEDTGRYNRYESDYVSTSRRKGPQSASSARFNNRYEEEEEDVAILEDLRRQIAEQQRLLSRMPSPSRTAVSSASSKYSMEELKEKIRRAYEDVSSATRSNPVAAQYLTHTETLAELLAEEKSLQDEIQYLCNRDIPVLARQLRGAAAELRDTKVRHSRQHDGTQDFMAFIQPTGPGGSITESDRVRAKAKAMMAARKTGSTTDAAYTLRRAEEEKQEADQKADAIEREMERSRTALLDMRGDLKYLEDMAAAKEIEDRKRFENGGSQELSFELRRFIEQLENKPVDTYGARQVSSSSGYNLSNVASPLTTSTANVSSPKPKVASARPRTADEIKKEAERRVQERLAALQAKRGISSPRSVTNAPPPVSKPDEAEVAAQQRLRDAERRAQDSLRNREENDRREAEQRRQRQEDQDRQRQVERQREQERWEQEKIEDAKRLEQEELEFQERKRQVLAKEEADRQARFDALRREEEAEEAKKQQQHKPHEEVDTPVVEATPPPLAPVALVESPVPVAIATEQSTSSNNPFAKLQQQGTSKAEKPNEAPTSAPNKRVSYNPFATFSAFSATKKNEVDSEEEEDDGWDVGHDSDDEFPAAGSAKNLAGMLFSAMSKRDLDTVPESPKQDHVPPPPPAPPVDTSAVPPPPPPPPAVDAFVPPPPPAPAAQATNNTFTPPAAPIGGGDMRNALLSQIQTGTKLKKTTTNDRSASSIAGHVIGDADAVQPAPAIEIAQPEPTVPLSAGNFLAELQAKTASSPPPVAAAPVHEAPEPVKELGPEHEYIALWDYPGSGADDLVFSQDDIILIRDANEDEDWWFGTLEKTKQTGYFPRNYVQPKPEDLPELNIKAKTLYDFEGPDGQGCLSFKMGDILTVLVKENDDWWKAEYEGQVGLVPANYLEEI